MAAIRITFTVAAILFLTTFCGVSAQAPAPTPSMVSAQAPAPTPSMVSAPAPSMGFAPGPSMDCLTYLLNMSDCLTYVESGSNLTTPDKGCCPELAGLVESHPICLCDLLGNSGSTGISIDLHKAIKLPSVCNVTTPPVSMCPGVRVPVAAPGPMSPGDMPPGPAASTPTNGASAVAGYTVAFIVASAIAFLPTFF